MPLIRLYSCCNYTLIVKWNIQHRYKPLPLLGCSQQQSPFYHSSVLQFNACFPCLHISQDVHAALQQSLRTVFNSGVKQTCSNTKLGGHL